MSAKEERPAVVCTTCGFAWHSAVMAYGLRLLGSCPRCDGRLEFGPRPQRAPEEQGDVPERPPHMALGLPRPPRRD
jgi:hypothetical protein